MCTDFKCYKMLITKIPSINYDKTKNDKMRNCLNYTDAFFRIYKND